MSAEDAGSNEAAGPEADTEPSTEEAAPLPVHSLFPMPNSTASFLVSTGGAGAGHLLATRFGAGNASARPGMPGGVSCAGHSADGRHYLLGSCDGAVRVYAVAAPFALPGPRDRFWHAQLHDMHHAVTGVCLSFDGATLTSAASDGSVFTLTLSASAPAIAAGARRPGRSNDELCSIGECGGAQVGDLGEGAVGGGYRGYTLEEARRKVEDDAAAAAAEAKKATVRDTVQQCAAPCPAGASPASLPVTSTSLSSSFARNWQKSKSIVHSR
jgi:hypothetical protein